MKTLTALFASALLTASLAQAQAHDLGPDQAVQLLKAGTIQPFETLNATAQAKHPGATVRETELEEEYGRYIYQVELRDAQGAKWDVHLDAASGQVLKDKRDD
ncbi:Peptidase propeptide and YPEB domain-containing protein [Azotobacter beijerinckii]|uniref:Peptidase propeptide and YPEB domain-containing protein n=1 Tax=Azotobacter beijerinckii TaxID=170623 RepID=A0A1H6XFG9_9GAMM|nr:PepSY domain-containing protein [Azotobacter beijerinckii]SEJ26866.1 Peptidase propeptide and YPEB domain-containing protein [Azotobacter beijerinckii]